MEDLVQIYSKRLGGSWTALLEEYLTSEHFQQVRGYLQVRSTKTAIYPTAELAFTAFQLCSYQSTNVVIIGQDPYPNDTANGLAFSTSHKLTPSLRNILDAMLVELNTPYWRSYDFSDLALQGVLLMNAALTVEHGKPGSHLHIWKPFTEIVIRCLKEKESLVWMIWGEKAAELVGQIPDNHLALYTVHPAASFYNTNLKFSPRFDLVNSYLITHGLNPIEWALASDDLPF